MSLSSDLVSQFVKVTKSTDKGTAETTVYGTTVRHEGRTYVQLDGSELLTPVSSTADAMDGERVTVTIKNHTATITGNLSSPSARTHDVQELGEDVQDLGGQIVEVGILLSYKVVADELVAIYASIDNLVAVTGKFEELTAVTADIETLRAKYAELDNVTAKDVKALNATIENLEATIGKFEGLSADDLAAVNAEIQNLRGYNADFTYVSADVLKAIKAELERADMKYANVDFANIDEAAIERIFSDYGLIKNIVVGDSTITGELIGVTIKGDLIEANTIKADKLIVKGEDGLYYKLNFESGTFKDAEEIPTEGLHGSVIIAQSVTADKISVSDLIAFKATIGGFHIGSDSEDKPNSIYSGVKNSIDNTTDGVFLDSTGQVAFGDASTYFKLYRDEDDNYRLAIVADSLSFSSGGVTKNVEDIDTRTTAAEADIQVLKDSVISMVTDENGNTLMQQTGAGWSFNLSNIQNTLSAAVDTLDSVSKQSEKQGDDLSDLTDLMRELQDNTLAYINVSTDGSGRPCIELGKDGDEFKVRITNESVDFMQGSSRVAYVSNNSLYIEKAIVKNELQIGETPGFVWQKRSNGNLGLHWVKGG